MSGTAASSDFGAPERHREKYSASTVQTEEEEAMDSTVPDQRHKKAALGDKGGSLSIPHMIQGTSL